MTTLADIAFDAQMDYYGWLTSDVGTNFSIGFFESLEEQDVKLIAKLVKGERYAVREGETYAVSNEIIDTLKTAAHVLPSFELHPSDVPAKHGWIYLEEPIVIEDRHERAAVIRAFAWVEAYETPDGEDTGEDPAGLMIYFVSETTDPRDQMVPNIKQVAKEDGRNPAPILARLNRHVLFHAMPLRYGDMTDELKSFKDQPGGNTETVALLLTFFRFIHEPWIDPRWMIAGRPTRKRAMRNAGEFDPNRKIKVVELRKSATQRYERNPDAEPCAWSHRWIVKGHWRKQWYPSQQRHAPKWIPSYVKGPEDRPLVVKDIVYQVDR